MFWKETNNLHILIYFILIYSSSSNLKYYLNAINFLQLSVSAICSQFHWKTSKNNELQLKLLVYSCIMHDCKIFRVYEKMKTGLPLIVCTKRTLSNSCAHFLYWSVLFIQFKTRQILFCKKIANLHCRPLFMFIIVSRWNLPDV